MEAAARAQAGSPPARSPSRACLSPCPAARTAAPVAPVASAHNSCCTRTWQGIGGGPAGAGAAAGRRVLEQALGRRRLRGALGGSADSRESLGAGGQGCTVV